MTAPTAGPRQAPQVPRLPRTSLWRLEWLRLTRSPRALVLGGVFTFFGLAGPVLAKYVSQLTELASGPVKIIAPPPTPRDGMLNYVSQTTQTGLIVVVVIAAGALSVDGRRGVSVFYRTRVGRAVDLVLPRYAVNALAAAAASTLGTLACWYGTALILGPLPATDVLAGAACSAVYLAFAVAVVAVAASLARGTLATVGVTLGALLALPVLGLAGPVHPWLPSTLVQAPVELLGTAGLADYTRALVVSVAAIPLLLWTASRRLARREV